MTRYFMWTDSPVGSLNLIAGEVGLIAIVWKNYDPRRVRLINLCESRAHPALIEAERQLRDYFAGSRQTFDLKLDFVGTDFQKKVWNALLAIPYGQTRSYAEIANTIGNSRVARAVGAANGKNPISIVAPCHRVIGSDGHLVAYAGGLAAKRYLLTAVSL
ncbi:MAG TPA: methylated-DNA--[protein]-cysteine S-methyltransferase [Steroidobacteraceae bacterium]|nr:methylated-DNA--[protein]-cysteine S-methyltransferase [Steroidobacteraceae bacterium]